MTLPRRDLSILAIGQSNLGALAQNTYNAPGFLNLVAANDCDATAEQNVFGACMKQLSETYGHGGIWAKHSQGSTSLVEFSSGGTQYAAVQAAESLLRTQFGFIDLVFVLIGETDAANNVATATYETYLDDFFTDLVELPTHAIICSPIDIDATPDSQRLKIRDACVNFATANAWAVHVELGSVSDDEAQSPSHMVLPATIDAARDLIVPTWRSLYG